MLHRTLWLCIILLIGSAFALDVPFVFEQGSTGFAAYSSAQLEQACDASPDLNGVPFASTPRNNEVLEFPVAGGSISPAGKTEKKAEEINKTLNSRVEPDNSRVHDLALALAAQHSGDYTIDQVCEIYSYLKYGNSTKKPWSYARDPRGVDYFNFASKSLGAGDDAKCAGAGDCDDFAILMSSLVESIGGTTRIILARNNSTGGHAYAEVYIGRLSDPNGRVEETIKWLQQEYDTEKIFTHIETDEKDVWLNLDWGNDAKGNAHPGGPFFQGDRHYVLCIRDKYGKTAVKPPEKANKPPKLVSLTTDRSGPQQAGAVITWTAEARDADKDPVLYRFFLNDDPVTKWTEENRWVWTTTEEDSGDSQIEVQVRDGKHAGPDKYDANMGTGFTIKASQPVPQVSTNQSDLAQEWIRKGDALFNLSNYDEAIKAYDKAIGLDPNYAEPWISKGVALNRQGMYDEAVKTWDEAIRLNPNDPYIATVWESKGQSLYSQGKYDEALLCMEKVIEMKPQFAMAWNNKGYVLYKLGKYDEALQAYNKCIELDSKDKDFWYNLGTVLLALDRGDEADVAFARATELSRIEDMNSI